MTFVDKDGEEKKIRVPIGMSMLEAAHENDIELEGKNSAMGVSLSYLDVFIFWLLLSLIFIFAS